MTACGGQTETTPPQTVALTIAAPRAPIPARSTSRSSYHADAKPAGQSRFQSHRAAQNRFPKWATPSQPFGLGGRRSRRTTRSDLLAKYPQCDVARHRNIVNPRAGSFLGLGLVVAVVQLSPVANLTHEIHGFSQKLHISATNRCLSQISHMKLRGFPKTCISPVGCAHGHGAPH